MPAHGWSSTPTRDLVVHVLGVAPLGLGSTTYRVAPARTGIRWLRAGVSTTAGLMTVDVEGARLGLVTPVPVRIVTWVGDVVDRPSGRHQVNLETGEWETA